MRTGSRSPTRPPFIEAPLPRSGATAAPVAVSNETVLHRGVEPYCNDFTHKRRGLQRDRPSSRHDVTMGRSEMGHGSRSPTRPPFIEACTRSTTRAGWTVAVSNETALHRGRGPSAIPAQLVPVAVSNETALHRGLFVPGTEPVPGYKSRSPTRPPFIEATSPATCATRMLVAVSNETALHRGLVKRGKRAKSRGRGLQRDRPSSRPGRGHRHPRRRRVAVSNETALHRGMPVPATGLPGGQVAVSNETAIHRGRRVVPGRQHTGEVAVSNGTALHRGSADTWLSEYLVPVAVSNETALHRGLPPGPVHPPSAKSRSPTRPPFIEASTDRAGGTGGAWSRSPTRPPFIEARCTGTAGRGRDP